MAAVSWCKSASSKAVKWSYLYISERVFSEFTSNRIDDLIRTSAPSLTELLKERIEPQLSLPLGEYGKDKTIGVEEFIEPSQFERLPSRYRRAIEHAVALFQFLEKKEEMSFAPVFTPLLGTLDESAKGLITKLLLPLMPGTQIGQNDFFEPYYGSMGDLKRGNSDWLRRHAGNLRRTLVFKNGLWPLGLLSFCLDYCRRDRYKIGGVFEAIRESFSRFNETDLYETVKAITEFRNRYIAHQEEELTDSEMTKEGLRLWIDGIYKIYLAHH